MKSASEGSNIPLLSKVKYLFKLLKMRMSTDGQGSLIPWTDMQEYEYYLDKYSSENENKLINHKVLEIGFGARPWRLFSMLSLGVDINGIDLDKPTYGYSPERLLRVLRNNGFERFMKSLVRRVFFDGADIRKLKNELNSVNKRLIIDDSRLIIGNAANHNNFEPNIFTFAFSEDVFEHIPFEVLKKVVLNLHIWLQPGSLLLVRPHIYTGISGGHDPDCYSHQILSGSFPKHKAWAHLIDPDFKITRLYRIVLRTF